jgi:hypothetical protein
LSVLAFVALSGVSAFSVEEDCEVGAALCFGVGESGLSWALPVAALAAIARNSTQHLWNFPCRNMILSDSSTAVPLGVSQVYLSQMLVPNKLGALRTDLITG